MAKKELSAGGARSLDNVLARLEELKRTPLGAVIYDQISNILAEYEAVQGKVDRTYSFLLHVLLDNYARNPTPANVAELNAKFNQADIASEMKPHTPSRPAVPPADEKPRG